MTAPPTFTPVVDEPTAAADLGRRAAGVGSQICAFADLGPIAASLGVGFPDTAGITRAVGFLFDIDIAQVLADLDAVVGANHSVAAAADLVAEQSVESSWQGRSGAAALAALDAHSRSGDSQVATLSDLASTAGPALEGLKTLLQNVFHAVDAVCGPTLAGCPVAAVPAALSAGTVRPNVVADEIAARVRLFDTATAVGRAGVRDILAELVGIDTRTSTGDLALAGEQ